MRKKIILLFILFFALPGLSLAESLEEKLSGKIVLQVEQNGEAWYINPNNYKRYFLGRPNDAFALMR